LPPGSRIDCIVCSISPAPSSESLSARGHSRNCVPRGEQVATNQNGGLGQQTAATVSLPICYKTTRIPENVGSRFLFLPSCHPAKLPPPFPRTRKKAQLPQSFAQAAWEFDDLGRSGEITAIHGLEAITVLLAYYMGAEVNHFSCSARLITVAAEARKR
jgi:hypothetical protein